MHQARRVASLLCMAVVLAGAWLPAGCSVSHLATRERYDRGLVIVLPGAEGKSLYNVAIARGLADGGVSSAIEIFDWTTGTPLGLLTHVGDYRRNRLQAFRIARRIASYQDSHPGRPVQLVGHSAGGAMAVLTLETLPAYRRIHSAFLLAPAISPDYDLRRALRRTEAGLWCYYSPLDVLILGLGTTIVGTVDRRHGVSAGATGFVVPEFFDDDAKRLYARKLHQVRWEPSMLARGNPGTHGGWATRRFAREVLAPQILAALSASGAPEASPPTSQPSRAD